MENGTELCQVYCGTHTIYRLGELYCFLPGSVQMPRLSLQESWDLGGCYAFCPEPAGENFPSRLLAYLVKWKTPPLFLWLENPSDPMIYWKINKMERYGAGQILRLGNYCIEPGSWQTLTVEDNVFVFRYEQAQNFGFRSGALRLPGCGGVLRLLAFGEDCGVLTGSLDVADAVRSSLMEQLQAGICCCCVDEKEEVQAAKRGFLEHAYNPVLEPKTAMQLKFRLALHHPLEAQQTSLSLAGYSFSTRIVTRTGHPVNLTAGEDAKLVLQQRAVTARRDQDGQLHTRTVFYWGISGSFRMEKPEEHLLCGLSGTESLVLQKDAWLKFHPSMPAMEPYEDQALGTTSWVGGTGGGKYYCQPQTSVFYYAANGQGMRMLEIPAAGFAKDVPPVPWLPYLGLTMSGTRTESHWEDGLYRARRAILLQNTQASAVRGADEGICAVTAQGLMAKVAQDGEYQWLGVASFSPARSDTPPDFCFSCIDQETRAQLQQKHLLYVIDSPEKMKALAPSEGFCFSIEGIRFDLRPKAWRSGTDGSTLLILQYSPECSMRQALKDHPGFQAVCKAAYTQNGELRSGYEDFAATVDDPHFEGVLACNAAVAVDSLPSEVQFLMNSIDPDGFYAAYLVIASGQIRTDAQGQPVLEASTVNGLIDYRSEKHLSYQSTPPDYDYLTTEIRISIRQSNIVSFYSSSEVLINRLFEAEAKAPENPDGNCLILQGCLVEVDQTRVYQYQLKQGVNYTLRGSGIASVWIDRLDLVTEEDGSGRFQLSGVVACQAMEGADLLGFGGDAPGQGLPFSQLVLRMVAGKQAEATRFSMEYGQLQFHQENAAVRKWAFPQVFAVRLEGFLPEKGGQTPEQKGYTCINAPIRQGTPGDTYQGFLWTLDVGSLGGLSGQGLVQLHLLTAFWPDGSGGTAYYLGMQLPGTWGSDVWKLQGLFGLGFDSFSLERTDAGYQLRLHNFQIQLLGTAFPQGNSDIVLFSDGKQIGWYAAYEEEEP